MNKEKIEEIFREKEVKVTVLERKIKKFGNGAHIIVPIEYLNENVKILLI